MRWLWRGNRGWPLLGGFRRVVLAGLVGVVGVLVWSALAGGTQPYETYESTVASDGPVAQFRFNDAAGSSTIADSVGSYAAANSGIVLGGEGPFGGSKSGSFGGEGYATLPADPLAGAGEFTAEAWLDWGDGGTYKQPVFEFGSSSSNYLYLTPASALSGHKLLFEIHTTAGQIAQVAASKLASGAWKYLAVTETNLGALTLYVNGEQVAQTTGATVTPASLGSAPSDYLGKSLASGEPLLKGSLSNVAFYTKALSATRIREHYDAGEYPVNTVAPTVTGTTRDGSTLSATKGTWTGLAPITFAYQWTRCNNTGEACTNIPAATEMKYTLGHGDVGSTLRVAVTASNSAGGSSATSVPTAVIEALKPSNTVLPAISGAAEQGQLLSASTGSWEGTPPLSYAYQWETCNNTGGSCKKITGATGSTYRVLGSQIGDTLRVIVTAENAAGSKSATSAATAVVTTGPPVNTTLPAISGRAEDGQTLSASTGAWAGTEPFSYTYQWELCNSAGEGCANITGATSSTYALGPGDVGDTLRVAVTAKNSVGSNTATSHASPVVAAIPPANTAPPAISGTARDGQTLSASTGSWSGSPPLSYAYQWELCNSTGTGCANIGGATSSTYTLGHADVGDTLRVTVTASNSGGSASSTSAATGVVVALAPSNTALPVISGTAQDGQTLSATTGEWAGTPPLSYTYQWQSCNAAGEACANVSGATGSTYTLGAGDVGTTLRVSVTASNSAGSAAASSQASEVVTAIVPMNVVAPAISGTTRVGQTLSASPGEWEGEQPISYAYQWQRCDSSGEECADVPEATGLSYELTESDAGRAMRVVVTASNAAGSESAVSEATSVVVEVPVNTVVPVITGTPKEGQELTASTGTWSAYPEASYTYQWQRCYGTGVSCKKIEGATGSKYLLGSGNAGTIVRVTVTATNTAGSGSASSQTTVPIEAIPPSIVEAPVIKGVPREGRELRANPGEWAGSPPMAFADQWESCDGLGEGCLPIADANGSSYIPGPADVGGTLRVSVTASNLAGISVMSASPPSGVVEAGPFLIAQFGTAGSGEGQLKDPSDIAFDAAGDVWVLDRGNDRVEEFGAEGGYLGQFGSEGSGEGQLSRPDALTVDAKGDVWVIDTGNDRVEEFSATGEYLESFGSEGSEPGEFERPEGIAVYGGSVWVADTGNSRLERFNEAGVYQQTIGAKGSGMGELNEPESMAIDHNGNVWVLEGPERRVEEYNEAGELIGGFPARETTDGLDVFPSGIAVDANDDIWVGDVSNNRVVEFPEKGYPAQFGGVGSGAGELQLSTPMGLGVDSHGDIWVADPGNDRVQEWTLPPSPPTSVAPPSVSGETVAGETLSATTGSWAGDPQAYRYQWQALRRWPGVQRHRRRRHADLHARPG